LNAKIGKIPSQERQFRGYRKQQKVKEELYLLQKRRNGHFASSDGTECQGVIDEAKGDKIPVSRPKKVLFI
jgi:hypothetical protein